MEDVHIRLEKCTLRDIATLAIIVFYGSRKKNHTNFRDLQESIWLIID